MAMDLIILEASGTSEWEISFGTNLQKTGLFYCQIFVISEIIAYAMLFKHLHDYNLEAEHRNLGISKEILKQRKRKNVVSFSGEFLFFTIEIAATTILQLIIKFKFL